MARVTSDFPMKWVVGGSLVCSVALALVMRFSFGIPAWMTVVALGLSLPLMLVGIRVVGETNWGPVSALSNMMQGIFGVLAPGHIMANMTASGVTGSVAVESEGLMQAYKTGDSDLNSVLDARRKLIAVKVEYLRTLLDFHAAIVELKTLAGGGTSW